jgi:hypothetical protein
MRMSPRQAAAIASDCAALEAASIGNSPFFNALDGKTVPAFRRCRCGPAEDTDLIAMFAVLGLLLLGGGSYAIYDGWPYLMIERGVTEVIVGSIAIGTGLIMLSLAWVLRQVRALRQALTTAIVARAEAPPLPAAAIGAVAVAQAAAAPEGTSAPEAVEAPPSPGERDLFGALVARSLPEQEPVAESEPAAAAAEDVEPLPDMFDEALPAPQPAEPLVEAEADSHEPAETPPSAVEEQSAGGADEQDEFSALRESLAGHLDEPAHEAGRIEPSFSPEPDPFAAAEAWMDRASPRREPWLDHPPVDEPAPVETPAPPWPPRTEAPAFDAPADEPEAQPAADAVEEPAEEAVESVIAEVEPEPAAEPEEEAAPGAPAASDEGVIGAYQVGDAHFTLYADGSIRARTPDGEYSFASMDELKVYLASEKSRLGV